MILNKQHKSQSRGFVISVEYMIVATLLGLTAVVALMGPIRRQMNVQFTAINAAVASVNTDSTDPVEIYFTNHAPGPEGQGWDAIYANLSDPELEARAGSAAVNFGTDEQGDGNFAANNGTSPTPWTLGTDAWSIEKTGVGAYDASLFSPTFTIYDEISVYISQQTNADLDDNLVDYALYYQVNGGAFAKVPDAWFTANGYDDVPADSTWDQRTPIGAPAYTVEFTSAGLSDLDKVQFRFDFDTPNISSNAVYSIYQFAVDSVLDITFDADEEANP